MISRLIYLILAILILAILIGILAKFGGNPLDKLVEIANNLKGKTSLLIK